MASKDLASLAIPPCCATLTLSSILSRLHLLNLCQGFPPTPTPSGLTGSGRPPQRPICVQGPSVNVRTSLPHWARLQKLRDYRLSIQCVAPLATVHAWCRVGEECAQGPTRWEGKACLHPLPTWLAELNGVELGGGESHPRMVPGGECHQKEASGTRARKGIQDNLKSDSQGNRPALS